MWQFFFGFGFGWIRERGKNCKIFSVFACIRFVFGIHRKLIHTNTIEIRSRYEVCQFVPVCPPLLGGKGNGVGEFRMMAEDAANRAVRCWWGNSRIEGMRFID